jgi:hypothetical protein
MYTYLSGEQYKLLPNALYICQFVILTVPKLFALIICETIQKLKNGNAGLTRLLVLRL